MAHCSEIFINTKAWRDLDDKAMLQLTNKEQ